MTDRPRSSEPTESSDPVPSSGQDGADLPTEAVFNSISAQARETNRIRVDALSGLITSVADDASFVEDRGRAKDLAHQIAGSAGTFGYVRASELAREVEELLVADDLDHSVQASLLKKIAELRRALD